MGSSQHQGKVTMTTEKGWVNVIVAWMGLSLHTPQVITHFIDTDLKTEEYSDHSDDDDYPVYDGSN